VLVCAGSDLPHSYVMLSLEKAANLFLICDVVVVLLGKDFLNKLIIFGAVMIQISVTVEY
jgi:hypothetical protein